MVNVDKLNKTIDELENKSKEIDSIIEKQIELNKLTKKIDLVRESSKVERQVIVENTKEIDKIINKVKIDIMDIDTIITTQFSGINKALLKVGSELNEALLEMDNNINNYIMEHKKGINISLEKQNENINSTNLLIRDVESNIRVIQGEITKKLNEIITENYKAINQFQRIVETKASILKDDLSLEIRGIENLLTETIKVKLNEFSDSIGNMKNDVGTIKNQQYKDLIEKDKENKRELEVLRKEIRSFKQINIVMGAVIIGLIVLGVIIK